MNQSCTRFLLKLFAFVSLFLYTKEARAQCQDISASIVSTVPAADPADSIIKICQGQAVTFLGAATFETSAEGATFTWKFGDGATASGTTASHTYSAGGVYVVDFIVTDPAGCTSLDCDSRLVVQVSTRPDFTGTSGPEKICLNDMASLTGVATPSTSTYQCAPPVSDTTFLEDSEGASYETSISVDCFTPCDTIRSSNDIASICLNIEHSFFGDLITRITCPNGQSTLLFDGNTGGPTGTYLGSPIDDDGDLTAGTGATYCFTESAAWGTMPQENAAGNWVIAGWPARRSITPGDFKPQGGFDALIGCPMNGDWTIQIDDDAGSDNGYIFSWEINFNPNLFPPDYSFAPKYVNKTWAGPGVISITDGNAVILPPSGGLNCYTFTATDEFGCSYDTSICVNVIDPGNPGVDTDVHLCANFENINLLDLMGGSPDPGGVWTGTGASSTGVFNPGISGPGTYTLVYTRTVEFCDTSATLNVTVDSIPVVAFDFLLTKGCSADTVRLMNNSAADRYLWNYDDGSQRDTVKNPVHVYPDQGIYDIWLVAINNNGCKDSTYKTVNTRHPISAAFSQNKDSICQSEDNLVSFTNQSAGNIISWHWDFGDGATSMDPNPTHSFLNAGTYHIMLVVTDDIPCTDTFYSMVYVDSVPFLDLSFDNDAICNGDRVNFTINYLYTTRAVTWDFGDGSGFDTKNEYNLFHSYNTPGAYTFTVTTHQPVCEGLSQSGSILVKPYPVVNLGPDTFICPNGTPVGLASKNYLSDPASVKWLWSTGSTSPLIRVAEEGIYRLTADLDGCKTTDEIEVKKDCYNDIPNSFTPNNDGINDYFYPRNMLTRGLTNFTMSIFDRWGQKLFETMSTDGRGWDGRFNNKDQPVGVYIYLIDATFKDGASEKHKGNVTLLR